MLGEQGKYSGVPMHIGHYRTHIDERVQRTQPNTHGFFSQKNWRIFFQSGVAIRLASLPSSIREPCCSLRYIGGDGTGIGLPINAIHHLDPVWKPPDGTRASNGGDLTAVQSEMK